MINKPPTRLFQVFAHVRLFGRNWMWQDIVAPFLITRLSLLLVGWFSRYFLPSAETHSPGQGWFFSPIRLLDIWGRWDTGWYMDIIYNGYNIRGNLQTTQSNIAFFPLYPYVIKGLAYFIPSQVQTPDIVLLVGVIVSNTLLLAALITLHKLIVTTWHDETVARRAVLYLLVFPTSFFFSSFYAESAFLFLSVAVFYTASRQNWRMASILGSLLALTRPTGVIIVIPLAWLYLESINWQLGKIRWNAIWLFLIPVALFAFLSSIYGLTGSLLAPIQIQSAWGKTFVMPWTTLINPLDPRAYVTRVEQVMTTGFLFLGIISLRLLPSLSYSIYSFLLMLIPLFSGMLTSNTRYCMVIFPMFIGMAIFGKHRIIDQFIMTIFLTLQILFMVAWSQFYWLV